jgi:hypothetical protein
MAFQNPGAFFQNLSGHTAELFRRAVNFDQPTGAGGVKNSTDFAVTAPVSGMSVNIGSGECLVPGTIGAFQGSYYALNDASVNLAIAASGSGSTQNRIDLACVSVLDAFYSGSSNSWSANIVSGSFATSPVEPSLPSSSLALAAVSVPNGITSVVSGDITGQQAYAVQVPILGVNGTAAYGPAPTSFPAWAGIRVGDLVGTTNSSGQFTVTFATPYTTWWSFLGFFQQAQNAGNIPFPNAATLGGFTVTVLLVGTNTVAGSGLLNRIGYAVIGV